MPESFEQPKIQNCPSKEDVLELRRIADTKATGANKHKIDGIISHLLYLAHMGETGGWTEEKLKEFNRHKTKFYEILSGAN